MEPKLNQQDMWILCIGGIILDAVMLSRIHHESRHDKFKYLGEILEHLGVMEEIGAYDDPELIRCNRPCSIEEVSAAYAIGWFQKHTLPMAHKHPAGMRMLHTWQKLTTMEHLPPMPYYTIQ